MKFPQIFILMANVYLMGLFIEWESTAHFLLDFYWTTQITQGDGEQLEWGSTTHSYSGAHIP